MKLRILVLAFIMTTIPSCSDSELKYGVNDSKISGNLICGKRSHPNDQDFEFCAVKLDHPVSIAAEEDNPYNPAESGVTEVQVVSNDEKIFQSLKEKQNSLVTVTGEIFHESTAWHVRTLVMDVQEIK